MVLKKIFFTLILILKINLFFAQKFAPENGKCYVFIGQDLEATGGLKNYNNGYSNYFHVPAGITIYTNLSPNNNSFGYINKGLDGLKTKANWGSGDNWGSIYLQDSTYKNTSIAIGLSFVNNEKNVAKGKLDYLIEELAGWIKSTNRPIFLRIGYEFDGWQWNNYNRKYYLKTWQRIHAIFKNKNVNNVAYVWQSKGTGSNQKTLEKWYPGDNLVDWCAYSYFGKPDEEMLIFARKHKKPVFISEATPVRQIDNLYFDTDLKKNNLGETIWQNWFVPFFKTINNNADVIKGFSYINSNWKSQPMWVTNATFNKVDSRLHVNKFISKKWREEIAKTKYLNASDNPWEKYIEK